MLSQRSHRIPEALRPGHHQRHATTTAISQLPVASSSRHAHGGSTSYSVDFLKTDPYGSNDNHNVAECSSAPARRAHIQQRGHTIHVSAPASVAPLSISKSSKRYSCSARPLPRVPQSPPPPFSAVVSVYTPASSPSPPPPPRSPPRPLPRPPSSSSSSESLHASCSSSNEADLAPNWLKPAPSPQSRQNKTPRLASLDTSPSFLGPPSVLNDGTIVSPLSPVPPSPGTVKRRQYAKLRRQLGESLPPELVYGPGSVVKHEESDDESDEEDVDASQPMRFSQGLHWKEFADGFNPDLDAAAGHPERLSIKWMREEGGQRWVERDYHGVLQHLRNL